MKKKLLLIAVMAACSAAAQNITFNDPLFKSFLLSSSSSVAVAQINGLWGKIDANDDGEISYSEAAAITSLYIRNTSGAPNITALSDISELAYFSNCLRLEVKGTAIPEINLSELSSLRELFIQNCLNLQQVVLSNPQELETLTLLNLPLVTSIDLSNSPMLFNIDIHNTSISSLDISGCPAAESVMVSDNQIATFVGGTSENLEMLGISNNLLASLDVSMYPNLNYLDVANNQLLTSLNFSNTSIQDQPYMSDLPNLEILNGSNSSLISLYINNYPNLTSVSVSGCNNLASMTIIGSGALPYLSLLDLSGLQSLMYVYCSNLNIDTVNTSNCPALVDLSIANSNLQTIDFSGCPMIEIFGLTGTALHNLDVSNLAHLHSVSVENNPLLETLDLTNCIALNNVYAQNCPQLKEIFAKNNRVENFDLEGNSALSFICQDEQFVPYTLEMLVNLGFDSVVVNSYCSFTPGGSYNSISGTISVDLDGNGCDATDLHPSNVRIDINDGSQQGAAFTDEDGHFIFYTDAGNFSLGCILENGLFDVSPSPATVSFANADNNTVEQDFCLSPIGTQNDVEMVLAPTSPARPGFPVSYTVHLRNKGNQTLSGTFSLSYPEDIMDFIGTAEPFASQSPGQLNWDYSALLPFENRSFPVHLYLNGPMDSPAVNLGDVLELSATATPVTGDLTPEDNTSNLSQIAVGSFDPNDISCIEGGILPISEIGNYLHYIVNFENTGTAAAENVVVRLEVDPDEYDLGSLQLLGASHANYSHISGNVVEFAFENIALMPSGGDAQIGHGNVLFKIRSDDGLSQGDVVSGKADIFFDYNFPIETNEAETIFQQLSLPDTHSDASISVYPNPSAGLVNVSAASGIKSLELFDLHGRLLQKSLNSSSIDLSPRSSGLYFLRITTEAGFSVSKVSRR